ncbi:hypothetical protein Tco_0352117 [Tanacetum coccineum]
MQVNVSSFVQQLQPEWSKFVTIVKQQHKLDEVSYHKLFDILKQYQKEVNEIHAERIANNANPLALVAAAQSHQDPYYQAPKSHNLYAPASKASLQTKSHATTRHKGKEIAKPIIPPSESVSEEDSDPEQAQKDKEMQKNLALIAKNFKKLYKPTNNNLITSSNTRNKNVDTTFKITRIEKTNRLTVKEQRKPKRVKDSTYDKEKMLLCKQAEKGVQLQAEQSDWLVDTDEEIDEQEIKAHYSYMAKIQEHSEQPESICNTCVVEMSNSNVILDSQDICDNDIQNEQNVVECDDTVALMQIKFANLKLDVDENKKIQKQLKKVLDWKRALNCNLIDHCVSGKAQDKVDLSKALDASLVDTESSGTTLKEQDTSSRSGNDAHADDADIRPIYDEEPMAEVQTTAEINVFAIGQ